MNLLGPLAKGMAALIGKQVPDTHVPRGGLGVELKEAGGSVEIAKVLDASPAAKAGLKPGDVVLELYPLAKPAASPAGQKPGSIAAALKAMSGVRPGDKVRLSIRRAPQTLEITAIAGEGF